MTNKLKSNLKQTLCGVLVAVAMLASCAKKNEGDNDGPQAPQAGAGDGNPGVGGSDGDHVTPVLKISIEPAASNALEPNKRNGSIKITGLDSYRGKKMYITYELINQNMQMQPNQDHISIMHNIEGCGELEIQSSEAAASFNITFGGLYGGKYTLNIWSIIQGDSNIILEDNLEFDQPYLAS